MFYFIKPLMFDYYSGYQIKKTKMGSTCSTYGREESCIKILIVHRYAVAFRHFSLIIREHWKLRVNCQHTTITQRIIVYSSHLLKCQPNFAFFLLSLKKCKNWTDILTIDFFVLWCAMRLCCVNQALKN